MAEENLSENIDTIDGTVEVIEDNTEISEKELKKMSKEDLWNEVGFHRITGGVFYSYVLLIVGAVVGLASVAIIAEFLPFPEINGYKTITAGILGFWFGLLDLNMGGGGSLSNGMSRFIGQYADTDPKRALEYIRFYIWFQMWTGIVQVTIISVISFTYFVESGTAYLTWFILAQTMVQYPGMLMIMEDSLKSFQRGDKTAWLSWLQDTVFQVTINILFLMIGKAWGESNPAIGEIMGITIFYILSQFVDDWINLLVGAKMFGTVLKSKGIDHGFIELMKPEFDKEIVKESLKFTGKQWAGGQVTGMIGYFINLYVIVNMPQMASWAGLLLIPTFLGHLVGMVPWATPTVPAISEAYNNGKVDLAQYFIHDVLKYYVFVTMWMAIPLIVLTPNILETIMNVSFISGLENYRSGLAMIPIMMLISGTGTIRGLWASIFVACDKPMPPIYIGWIFTIPGFLIQFLFIYLCIDAQALPPYYVLIMPTFITSSLQMVVGYAWLHKTTIKINYKKIAWQVLIAPMLTSICYAIVLYLFQLTMWDGLVWIFTDLFRMGEIGGVVFSFLILLALLFIFPAIFYAPFYAFFGGWDDFTLEEFRKCAEISGPSKFIMMMLYNVSAKFSKMSKWSNKFPIADYEVIKQQVQELVDEGKANKLLEKQKKKN